MSSEQWGCNIDPSQNNRCCVKVLPAWWSISLQFSLVHCPVLWLQTHVVYNYWWTSECSSCLFWKCAEDVSITQQALNQSLCLKWIIGSKVSNYREMQPGITARREHVTIYHSGRREDVTISSLQTWQLHGIVNMAQPVEKYPEVPSKWSTVPIGRFLLSKLDVFNLFFNRHTRFCRFSCCPSWSTPLLAETKATLMY